MKKIRWVVVCAWVGCTGMSAPASAAAPSVPPELRRCVGASIPGAFFGALAGEGLGIGALSLWRKPKLDSTDVPWILPGIAVGAITGPILSCAIWQPEAHVVPRASFVIAGAIVGGAAAGAGSVAITGTGGDDFHGPLMLAVVATSLGAGAGGFGGSYLHHAVFSRRTAPMALVPNYLPGGGCLSVVGAF